MSNKVTNQFVVIPIEDLPYGVPVLAVQEFSSKDMANFHLVEKVLWPTGLGDVKEFKPAIVTPKPPQP